MTNKTQQTTSSDCIFCKIIKGEVPSVKIWEDKNYYVFLDKNQAKEGHSIIIPKKHSDYLFDLADKEYSDLMLKAKEIANKLKSKYKTKRVILLVEGFQVNHVHIHLIPSNEPLKE